MIKNKTSNLCFFGGDYKVQFFIHLVQPIQNPYLTILCKTTDDAQQIAHDLVLLKEFVKNQNEKVNHE